MAESLDSSPERSQGSCHQHEHHKASPSSSAIMRAVLRGSNQSPWGHYGVNARRAGVWLAHATSPLRSALPRARSGQRGCTNVTMDPLISMLRHPRVLLADPPPRSFFLAWARRSSTREVEILSRARRSLRSHTRVGGAQHDRTAHPRHGSYNMPQNDWRQHRQHAAHPALIGRTTFRCSIRGGPPSIPTQNLSTFTR